MGGEVKHAWGRHRAVIEGLQTCLTRFLAGPNANGLPLSVKFKGRTYKSNL